ncbi:MAG TPA: acyl carrier protein [Candidatus Egerieousia sp.]|nr:acyl carrier protein [Candidatus Egerieousia sp.]
MERAEVLKKVNDVFRDVLDNDEIVLKDETTADDVEGWDSLSHIQLVVAVEKAFKIKFTSGEILRWKNIGEMVDSILSKNVA